MGDCGDWQGDGDLAFNIDPYMRRSKPHPKKRRESTDVLAQDEVGVFGEGQHVH